MTINDAIDHINNGGNICRIPARTLKCKVWIAENGLPGCLPDSHNVCRTKANAIDLCAAMADNGEGPPRGMVTALRQNEVWRDKDGYRYMVSRVTLGELL